eukprot:GSMAST32.ASY1.ANO1.904.1 assembled CDS
MVTIWYRPPELLFGSRNYGVGVDMWSIGCIFAELLLKKPFLAGQNVCFFSQFFFFRTPTEAIWPGMTSLPSYIGFTPCKAPPLKSLFIGASSAAVDLISKLLIYDPSKRISAKEALRHKYFTEGVQPTQPKNLAAAVKLSSKRK